VISGCMRDDGSGIGVSGGRCGGVGMCTRMEATHRRRAVCCHGTFDNIIELDW